MISEEFDSEFSYVYFKFEFQTLCNLELERLDASEDNNNQPSPCQLVGKF